MAMIAIFGANDTTRNKNQTTSLALSGGLGYPTLKKLRWVYSSDHVTPKQATVASVKYNNMQVTVWLIPDHTARL